MVFILSHTQTTVHTLTGVHDTVTESMCMECACSAGHHSSMQRFLLGLPSLTMIGCDVIDDSDLLGPLCALIGAKERERERERTLLVLKSYLFPS